MLILQLVKQMLLLMILFNLTPPLYFSLYYVSIRTIKSLAVL